MARKTTVTLQDDLDGTPATQTLRFGFQGIEYELDLNDENANEMTHWLEHYISHARRVGGSKRPGGAVGYRSEVDPKLVRQWANREGIGVSLRGRIPGQLVAQYKAAVGD